MNNANQARHEKNFLGLRPQTYRVLVSVAVVAIVSELVGRYVIKSDLVFAPLSDIFARLVEMAGTGELWKNLYASGIVFVFGYALAGTVLLPYAFSFIIGRCFPGSSASWRPGEKASLSWRRTHSHAA